MSILIKSMEMPPKGEYEFTLYVDADGEAYLESPSMLFPENFECIEVPEDVASVEHGRWIKPTRVPDSMLDECSICGFDCGAYTFNYCPNCGAKMDLLN